MTSVDGASRTPPSRPSHSPSRADPGDVRAMRDALEAARGKVPGQPMPTGGKPAPQAGAKPLAQGSGKPAGQAAGKPGGERGGEALAAREDGSEAPAGTHAKQRDDADAVGAWSGQPQAGLAPQATADLPSPQLDPGGFAQMLADLWTRENGRGSREVRVRFGDRAWPATGARLVRNPGGSLDITLLVGDGGQAYGGRLPQLEDALGEAGVDLASLAVEDDA